MSVRPAKAVDTFRIAALIEEMYRQTAYVGRDEPDMRYTRSLISQSIQRHGAPGCGGTFVIVSEDEGVVQGFALGILDRVYHVGTKLMATDLFFYNSPAGRPRDAIVMLDQLIAWGEANPRVIEIKLGAMDAVGDYRRTEKLFQRKGFVQCGVLYTKEIAR